jgi:hypothetical protein
MADQRRGSPFMVPGLAHPLGFEVPGSEYGLVLIIQCAGVS